MLFWSNGRTLHYLKKVDITLNVTNIVLLRIYNERLRAKIRDYKENGKDEWKSFKTEFKHDMDELGDAIKGLTVDNKK